MYSFSELKFLLENYQERLAKRGVNQDVIDYIDSIESNSDRGKIISKAMSNPRLTLDQVKPKERFRASDNRLHRHIISADPTPNNDYYETIYNWAKGKQRSIILPEDIVRIKEVLEHYNKHKNRYSTKYISKYKGFTEVEQEWLDVSGKEKGMKETPHKNMRGAELLHKNSTWRIYLITSKEAACYYGGNTRWCTARTDDGNQADYYIGRDGGLYIYINDKTYEKFQASMSFEEFMDVKDNPVGVGTAEELLKLSMDAKISDAFFAAYSEEYIHVIKLDAKIEKEFLNMAKTNSKNEQARYADWIFDARNRHGRSAVTINLVSEWEKMLLSDKRKLFNYISISIIDASNIIEQELLRSKDAEMMSRYCIRLGSVYGSSKKARRKEFEPYIIDAAENYTVNYAKHIIGGRWKECEGKLKNNKIPWIMYLRDVIKGPLPYDIEDIIDNSPVYNLDYASDIAKKRVPDYEFILNQNPNRYLERHRNDIWAVVRYCNKFDVKLDKLLLWMADHVNPQLIYDYVSYTYKKDKIPDKVMDIMFLSTHIGMNYVRYLKEPLKERKEIQYFDTYLDSDNTDKLIEGYCKRLKRELPIKVLKRFSRSPYYAAKYSVEVSGKPFPIPETHEKILEDISKYSGIHVNEYIKRFGDE